MATNKIEISNKSIIRVILWVALFYILYCFKSLILVLFLAVIIASIVNRFANLLKRISVPRVLSIIIFYVSFLLVIFFALYNFLPAAISYISNTIKELHGHSGSQIFLTGWLILQ